MTDSLVSQVNQKLYELELLIDHYQHLPQGELAGALAHAIQSMFQHSILLFAQEILDQAVIEVQSLPNLINQSANNRAILMPFAELLSAKESWLSQIFFAENDFGFISQSNPESLIHNATKIPLVQEPTLSLSQYIAEFKDFVALQRSLHQEW